MFIARLVCDVVPSAPSGKYNFQTRGQEPARHCIRPRHTAALWTKCARACPRAAQSRSASLQGDTAATMDHDELRPTRRWHLLGARGERATGRDWRAYQKPETNPAWRSIDSGFQNGSGASETRRTQEILGVSALFVAIVGRGGRPHHSVSEWRVFGGIECKASSTASTASTRSTAFTASTASIASTASTASKHTTVNSCVGGQWTLV